MSARTQHPYLPDKASTSSVFPTADGAFFSSSKEIRTFATSILVILPTATSPWLNNGLWYKKENLGIVSGEIENESRC